MLKPCSISRVAAEIPNQATLFINHYKKQEDKLKLRTFLMEYGALDDKLRYRGSVRTGTVIHRHLAQ